MNLNSSVLDQFKGFLDTPDIFPKDHRGEFPRFEFPKIEITEALKADLKNLVHPRNSVLGKRMESFFEIAIKHSQRYDLVASNIQIIENKQTLGELDFLVYDRKLSKTLHVELVYKLYVYDDSFPSEINRWIGPNRRDSFVEKMNKLGKRQFPLLYNPSTKAYLREMELLSEEIEQQLCFKAQLFLPENNSLRPDNLVNKKCFYGNWYKMEQFLQMDVKKNLFYSPKKKNWSCDPENHAHWKNLQDILEEIHLLFKQKKAPLLWMKSASAFHRFFIVWW